MLLGLQSRRKTDSVVGYYFIRVDVINQVLHAVIWQHDINAKRFWLQAYQGVCSLVGGDGL